jgi:hypothetical protein
MRDRLKGAPTSPSLSLTKSLMVSKIHFIEYSRQA